MKDEEIILSPEEENEITNTVIKRLKLQPEFIQGVRKLQTAKTMGEATEAYEQERQMILNQAGPEAIKRQHKLGRLTARERISKLADPESFREIDQWHRPYETGFDIGEEKSRGDGVVIGWAQVGGRPISLYGWDATIMGGTVATVGARKVNMIMDDTASAKIPIVGMFDSEGLRAHDVIQYPEFYSTSTMAYFHSFVSGVIPSIAMVMGPCTGDLALIASLSDFVFMVKNTSYMHLAEPPPGVSPQELGDPWNVHAKVTGCCDVICNDEEDALKKCRQLLSFLPLNNTQKAPVVATGDDPNRCEESLLEIVPTNTAKPFSIYKVISLIVDNGEFFEIKRYFASNIVVGFARFDGKTVGIVASNSMYKGGAMTIDATNKEARFVRFCDAFNIPVVWLTDCPAFLPALDEERRGLIRTGSGVIYSNAELTTPHITIYMRKIYGGSVFAHPGKTLGGDLQLAWPTYEPGLMGPQGATNVIYRRELEAIKDPVEKAKRNLQRVEEMRWGIIMQMREGNQGFIDPRQTRPWIISSLKWLENKKEERPDKKHENIRV